MVSILTSTATFPITMLGKVQETAGWAVHAFFHPAEYSSAGGSAAEPAQMMEAEEDAPAMDSHLPQGIAVTCCAVPEGGAQPTPFGSFTTEEAADRLASSGGSRPDLRAMEHAATVDALRGALANGFVGWPVAGGHMHGAAESLSGRPLSRAPELQAWRGLTSRGITASGM